MAALNFDPMAFQPLGDGFTVYPAGWYPVAIKSHEIKGTSDNTSGFLLLNCDILDGPHKGGNLPVRLNLYNQSEAARDFANRMLTSICFACHVYALPDGSLLHGIPFQVQLDEQEMDYRPQDDRSKPKKRSNNVVAIRDINGNMPGRPGDGQGGAPASDPAAAAAAAHAAAQQAQPVPTPAPAPAAWTPPATQTANPASPAPWTPPAEQQPAAAQAQPWTPPATQQQQQPPASAPWGPPQT